MSVHPSSRHVTALFCVALLGAGCGLTDALGNGSTPRIPLTSDAGGGGGDDVGDAGTPDPDAGDAGEEPECEGEGDPNACAGNAICYQGACEPLCGFGFGGGVNPIDGAGGFLTCPDDLECVPVQPQDDNRYGACVTSDRLDGTRANPVCPGEGAGADESPQDDYCKQLFRENDYTCQSGRCGIPCGDDSDCAGSEYCEEDLDGNGFCVLIDCEDAGADLETRAGYCADVLNRIGAEHPSGSSQAFTSEDAYCLNGACYVRADSEAETTCGDDSMCPDDDVCVSQDYCMAACSSDFDCPDDLFCAYTLPADERLDTEDDVSAFVCVDYAGLNVAQLADPIAFCDDPDERDGRSGTPSWDRDSGDCVYDDTPDGNSVWYVLIQDDTFDCAAEAPDGDLPGAEDPGVDIAFVGLSDASQDMPTNGDAFGSVYAHGKVVRVFPGASQLDNDYPGYGHLAPLFPAADGDSAEVRYRQSDGCPVAAPAPNTTFSLGCGGAALVEFRTSNGIRANLNDEGSNKFIVVSEYSSTCDSSGINPADPDPVFENYKVTYCPTGVSLGQANPGSCSSDLLNVQLAMPMADGPAVFGFP
jgi:hypothetical protein